MHDTMMIMISRRTIPPMTPPTIAPTGKRAASVVFEGGKVSEYPIRSKKFKTEDWMNKLHLLLIDRIFIVYVINRERVYFVTCFESNRIVTTLGLQASGSASLCARR